MAIIDHDLAVLEAIKAGSAGGAWIGAADIAAWIISHEREVRRAARRLVLSGQPIVAISGIGGGFKYVTDPAEVEAYKRRLYVQIYRLAVKAKAFDRTGVAADLAGQVSMRIPIGERAE